MMLSPEAYYEMTLKGKSKEEIEKEIQSLKETIEQMKKDIKAGKPDLFMPSRKTRLSMEKEYLKYAQKAYRELYPEK